jgi:hypothetical protein
MIFSLFSCVVYGQEVKKVAYVKVFPEKVVLAPGQTHAFTVKGYDKEDQEIPFTPEWDQTGGSITTTGLYTAGQRSGVYGVMVTCPKSGAQGSAVVIVQGDDSKTVKVVPSEPEKKELAKDFYFKILKWEMNPDDGVSRVLRGSYEIHVQVVHPRVASLQLVYIFQNSTQKTVIQAQVKAVRQIVKFKGKYYSDSTKALAIFAYDAHKKEIFFVQESAGKKIPPDIIPGGYIQQDPDSQDMQEMAQKAAALMQKEYPNYKLIKVHKAATQVVAGINYFFVLEFQAGETKPLWKVTMYVALNNEASLTQKEEIK